VSSKQKSEGDNESAVSNACMTRVSRAATSEKEREREKRRETIVAMKLNRIDLSSKIQTIFHIGSGQSIFFCSEASMNSNGAEQTVKLDFRIATENIYSMIASCTN
jgi:hypothetical protein